LGKRKRFAGWFNPKNIRGGILANLLRVATSVKTLSTEHQLYPIFFERGTILPHLSLFQLFSPGMLSPHCLSVFEAGSVAAAKDLSFNALGIPWAVAAPQRRTVPGGP
jgi:hypothetical protein